MGKKCRRKARKSVRSTMTYVCMAAAEFSLVCVCLLKNNDLKENTKPYLIVEAEWNVQTQNRKKKFIKRNSL